MSDRRLGQFAIDSALIVHDPAAVRTALEGCIIVRAELLYDVQAIHYVALHDEFYEVPPGQPAYRYVCELTKNHHDGSVTRRFVRIL